MMNAADRTVPSDTAQIVARCTRRGSLSHPNSHRPRNVDSRKNAARPSMANGAPKRLPTNREYAPQSMPNWNSCTSPVTTPIATLMTSSVPKNRVSRRYSSRLVRYHAVCSSAVKNASPIVTGTKKKWLIVTNANCHLARSTFIVGHLRGEGCTFLRVVLDGHDARPESLGHRPDVGIAGGDAVPVWPSDAADAREGLHPAVMEYLAGRKIALLGSDGNNDTAPSAVPGVDFPVHVLAIATLGVHLIDYLDFSALAPLCAEFRQWSFLCVVAPLRLAVATGSPVNPVAIL